MTLQSALCLWLFRTFPIIDVGLGVLAWIITNRMWQRANVSSVETSSDERQLGATAILGQFTGTITASTIILAGIGGVIALATLPAEAKSHLFWAALLSLSCLGSLVWALGTVPPLVSQHNLAKSRQTALFAVSALYLFLASAVRFSLALWTLLGWP